MLLKINFNVENFLHAQNQRIIAVSFSLSQSNQPTNRFLFEIHPSLWQLRSGISRLFHVVPGPAPVRVRFVRVPGRKRRALSRVVFPEGHVDQREAASGEHGGAVVPLVPRFPCPAVRVMLLRLVIEQPLQREAATTRRGKNVARLTSRMRVQLRLWKGIGKGVDVANYEREREREKNLKGTTRFLFLAPRKEKILPRRSAGVGDRALFKLICLIKFVSIPFFLPREDEIIPKSHRSPAKAHQSSLPRPLEEGREKGGEWGIRAAGAPIFSSSFFLLCPWWTLRERYPHHFLDQGVPFRKQSLRGLAEGAKDTCSTVEIHPERIENWKN